MNKKEKGFTVWFTGLPCAGKTTLAMLLAAELESRGYGVDVLEPTHQVGQTRGLPNPSILDGALKLLKGVRDGQ